MPEDMNVYNWQVFAMHFVLFLRGNRAKTNGSIGSAHFLLANKRQRCHTQHWNQLLNSSMWIDSINIVWAWWYLSNRNIKIFSFSVIVIVVCHIKCLGTISFVYPAECFMGALLVLLESCANVHITNCIYVFPIPTVWCYINLLNLNQPTAKTHVTKMDRREARKAYGKKRQ